MRFFDRQSTDAIGTDAVALQKTLIGLGCLYLLLIPILYFTGPLSWLAIALQFFLFYTAARGAYLRNEKWLRVYYTINIVLIFLTVVSVAATGIFLLTYKGTSLPSRMPSLNSQKNPLPQSDEETFMLTDNLVIMFLVVSSVWTVLVYVLKALTIIQSYKLAKLIRSTQLLLLAHPTKRVGSFMTSHGRTYVPASNYAQKDIYSHMQPEVYYVPQHIQKLAEEVIQWAKTEMSALIRVGQIPDAFEVKKICRGNMVPIFEFLVNRVKDQKNGKRTQELRDAREDRRRQLLKQKQELMDSISDVRGKMKQTYMEIEEASGDIRDGESKLREIVHKGDRISMEISLMKSFERRIERYNDMFQSYAERLKQLNQAIEQLKSADKARESSVNVRPSSAQLTIEETVRKICQYMSESSNDQLRVSAEDSVVSNDFYLPDDISPIAQIGYRSSTTTPSELFSVLGNLLRHATSSAGAMQKDTESIDRSEQHLLISDHLHQLRQQMVKRAVEREECMNRMTELRWEIVEKRSHRDSKLDAANCPPAVKALSDLELDNTYNEAVSKFLDEKLIQLRSENDRGEMERGKVDEKSENIKLLNEKKEIQQNLIQWITHQNKTARKKLLYTIDQFHRYATDHFGTMEAHVKRRHEECKDWVDVELQVYDGTDFDRLLTLPHGNVPVRTTMTNLLHDALSSENDVLQRNRNLFAELTGKCRFPREMAGDRFLEHCTTLENQLHEKSHRLRSRRRLHEDSSTTSQVDERRLQELMDNFDRETKDHMENWRDTLHGTTEILTNGLADVAEVREIAEEWWEQKWRIRGSDGDRYEQPGRMVVPWYEVKGKDFRGTLDKCMSICTEINQLEKPNIKRRWSSGRISACHAGDPGSIPGRRTVLLSCTSIVVKEQPLLLAIGHLPCSSKD
ncbi:hypothetical protein PROFUN_07548 [Planoprotostelium fungivorum]|uniref:Uncharacterized protein n=1 Tax=Planoprotostelium fungivorum TaxID=1890364 RepID=A0A2P6NLQ7_9EUKA|nr:hypothetical protein PROFUN_07548 [Planoprotostelium fungivorum]